MKRTSLIALSIIVGTTLGAQSTLAFGFDDFNGGWFGDRDSHETISDERTSEKFKGFSRGFHGMRGMHTGLLEEEGFSFEDVQNMTDEEREALYERMKVKREEMKEEQKELFENTNITHKDIRGLHNTDGLLGEFLEEKGVDEAEVEEFFNKKTNNRVDALVEQHDLDEDVEETLRERAASFMQRILGRWFGSKA